MVELFTGSLFLSDVRLLGRFVGNICQILLTEAFSESCDSIIRESRNPAGTPLRDAGQASRGLAVRMLGRGSSFTKGTCCAKERIRPCVWYKLVVTEHGCLRFPGGYTFFPVDLAGGNSSHPLMCVLAVSASGMGMLAVQSREPRDVRG